MDGPFIPATVVVDPSLIPVSRATPLERRTCSCLMRHIPDAAAWARSSASTIISSWPPTLGRRPTSTRIARVSTPYVPAAVSAFRRKLE
jgi:hypothetical protein